jgi:hypothetical protein
MNKMRSMKRQKTVQTHSSFLFAIVLSPVNSKGCEVMKNFPNLFPSRCDVNFCIQIGAWGNRMIKTRIMIDSMRIKVDNKSMKTIYLRIRGTFREGPFVGNLKENQKSLKYYLKII